MGLNFVGNGDIYESSHFDQYLHESDLLWVAPFFLTNPDMADSCQQTTLFPPTRFSVVWF
jgi:hypothetical protein